MRRVVARWTGLAVWLAAASTTAASVDVQGRARLELGNGSLTAGCADVLVSGTLDVQSGRLQDARSIDVMPDGSLLGGSGTIRAAGPWSNAGLFAAGTGSVELLDGCGVVDASITGDNAFASLTLNTVTGKTFRFEAGSTQTVNDVLRISGEPGNLLRVRSTIGGTVAFLNVQGTSATSYVDVDDNSTLPGNPIALGSESIKGPNTPGWLFVPIVPALPLAAASVLGVALLWLSRSKSRFTC